MYVTTVVAIQPYLIGRTTDITWEVKSAISYARKPLAFKDYI